MHLLYLSLLLLFVLNGCKAKDDYFWTNSKTMPALKTKEGELIDVEILRYVGQYNSFGDITQEYKGPIKGSIVAVWKVIRLKGGKTDLDKVCGEEPKDKDYTRDELIHELDRVEREREIYNKKYREAWVCYKKHQAEDKQKETTHYYYARTPKSHQIVYPKKSKRHAHWEFTMYGGRVGDLTPYSLTPEQKKHIEKLTAHPCYKYTARYGVWNKACYDLPGEDKNIYYTIREVIFANPNKQYGENPNYHPLWEDIDDVRFAAPSKWIEVKGMEIDEKMYEYLKKECFFGEKFCHLENYKGKMTPEQKVYVKRVSWK